MASMFSRLAAGGAGRTTALRAISVLAVTPLISRRHVVRCDDAPRTSIHTSFARRHLPLNPSTVNQVATGSLAGLLAGVLLRTMSQALLAIATLIGLATLAASRMGFDSKPIFRRIMHITHMERWNDIGEKIVFKLAFFTTLVLATFVRL